MPTIDVTDILFDSDIAGQSFEVIRRQETTNDFGESVWLEERIPNLIGSVQPYGENSLDREDSFDAQYDSVKIATTFRLRGVAKGPGAARWKPDIVLWCGGYYEVTVINSWAQFGAGFIDAEALSVQYVDPPPPELAPPYGQLDFSRPFNSGYAHGAGGAF